MALASEIAKKNPSANSRHWDRVNVFLVISSMLTSIFLASCDYR